MTDRMLFDEACRALELAYAPYSEYCVGACLLAEDGRVYVGANIENASYGLSMCAERTALYRAVLDGARRFSAIAVAGRSSVAWPCGACRQVLNEFAPDLRVICGQVGGEFQVTALSDLLPHAFGPESF